MSGTDLVGLIQQHEQMRQVAGSYDGFQKNPGLAASLVSAGVDHDQVEAIGGFVKGLDLSKQVVLARQSGVMMDLSDEDRGLLTAMGSRYDDVDKGQQVSKQWTAGRGGTLGELANWANNVATVPGVKQTFSGLNRIGDIGSGLYRSGVVGGFFGLAPPDVTDNAENFQTMQQQHYSPDFLGTMAFYSRGKLQFHNLDDLRKQYSPDLVNDAKAYLIDPSGFMDPNLDAETLAARDKQLQDPQFQSLVTEVDGRHVSPGRDLANSLGLRPGTKPFTVVSGSADALYSFYADPTIVLGKANKGITAVRFGLGSLSDTGRIEDLMRGNRAIRNGWTQLLDSAKTMRVAAQDGATAEDVANGAAAYARVRATTPDLLPMLDEINGGGLRAGKVINSYEDLVKHVTGAGALTRLSNGIAAKEAPLMPGALSSVGYGAVRGALASAAARHGLKTIDVAENPGRLLTTASDAVDAAGTDVSGLAGVVAAGGDDARAVGEAAAKWRRSARGRVATTWNRMSTLLPEHGIIDLSSGQGAEDIRRFAALYMPRAHGDALAAKFAVGSLAERRAIAEAAYEQVLHAAGLTAPTSGRAWLEAERTKRAFEDTATYDASGKDLDKIEGVDGEATRRNALYFGQTSTHFVLPNTVMLRRVAAKVSIYDHVLRSGMESATLDKVMHYVRMGWLLNPASAGRQALEANLAASADGLGQGEMARARVGLSTITARRAADHLAGMADREVDDQFHKVKDGVRGILIGRIASNMRRAEAFVGLKMTGTETLRRSAELHAADINGDMNELKAITGFGTRAAHESMDDARELLSEGYKPATMGFKRAGWHLDSADGAGGARYWADELGRRFNGPKADPGDEFGHLNGTYSEAPHVLRAALADAQEFSHFPPVADIRAWWAGKGNKVPKDVTRVGVKAHRAYVAAHPPLLNAAPIRDVREWWKAQGHTVPSNESRVSMPARRAYADAHVPKDELVNYLLSDRFAQGRATMERFHVLRDGTKVGDDPELLKRAAQELAADQIEDMRALITGRNGKIHPDLAAHLQRGFYRRGSPLVDTGEEVAIGGPAPSNAARSGGPVPPVSFLHALGEDARPEKVIQPKYVPDLSEGGNTPGNIVQALGRGYEYAVHRPTQWLASSPIFGAYYARAYRNLAPAIKQAFPDMPSEFQQEAIREAAIRHAMDATVKVIDNPRVQTQMSLITRNVFNFWRAQEDFARRWGRILKENPEALRKAQLITEGGMHVGLVHKDEQGNLVFSYPGSGYAIQALGKALGVLHLAKYQGIGTVPNLTTKLQFLNSGIDRPFLPSTSPVASLPLRALKHLTGDQVGMVEGIQLSEGNVGASRGWWSQFLPSPVYRVLASQSTDEREGQYASALRGAALNLVAAGKVPPANASPDQQNDFKNNLRVGVRNQLLSRALLALILPGAPSNPTEETGESQAKGLEAKAFNAVTLSDEYHAMVNRYGPQKALAVWTAAHPDKLMYTVATTQGGGYIAPTDQALGWLKQNPDLIKQFPSLSVYFAPNGPGDFSQEAWQTELELGLRQHKDLDTFYRDITVKGAEKSYFDMRDKRDALIVAAQARGDNDEVKRLNASFSAWSQDLQDANPLLVEKWQASTLNKTKIAQLMSEVSAFAGSPMAKRFDANGDLPHLVDAYTRKKQFDDTHRGRTDADEAEKSRMDASYKDYVGRLLGRSPYLIPLYRGVYGEVK